MKILIGIMGMLLPLLPRGQSPLPNAVHLGESVPVTEVAHIYNYPVASVHIPGLHKRLIILDFWATWCSSCIAGFSHADSLQREFDKDIQVFLVNSKMTHDSHAKIIDFFKKRQARTGLVNTLPVITEDTVLDTYFPHSFIPHYVWIDSGGRLLATTSSLELNRNNILAILAGNNFAVHIKTDAAGFNRKKPPFWEGNGNAGNLMYRTVLTGYSEGLYGSGRRVSNDGLTTGLYFFNVTLLDLYRSAFENNKGTQFVNNRITADVKNAGAFRQSFYDDTSKYSHTYCYDITVPPSTEAEMKRYMQQDLERIFKITVAGEKRELPCIVLTTSARLRKSIAGKSSQSLSDLEKETLHKFVHNQPVALLVQLLNIYSPLPIIDETHLTASLDMELPYQLSDTEALIKSLTVAGFRVKKETRLLDVTVIKDIVAATPVN